MKKVMVLMLVAAVVVSAIFLASCGKKQTHVPAVASTSADVPGWTLNADKPIRFDWYIHYSWFNRQWGESRVSKYVTAKTGVDLRFIVPAGNEAERLNAMITGNALPDFITLWWGESQIPMMIDAGLVYPLNELAEQYDPFFFAVANKEKLAWHAHTDGNTYGYPNASFSSTDMELFSGMIPSTQTFLVRKDMYEAIGSPDMTTPDGFLNALRAARDKFPTIGGQPVIPLGLGEFDAGGNGYLQGYLLNFLAIPPETQDGMYYDPELGPNHHDYVTWLKTIRQAASEGLISMEVFVDKRSQIEEKAAQGRYFAILYSSGDMEPPQVARYAIDPDTVYIAVDGPRNSRGDPHTLAGEGITGWTLTLISKNVKDRARAIQFMSYLISEEGQMDLYFGVPENNPFGMEPTFTWVDGTPTLLPEIEEMQVGNINRQEIEIGAQFTYWMLMDSTFDHRFPKVLPPVVKQPQIWTFPFLKSFDIYDRLEMEPGSEYSAILETIRQRWGRDLPKLILAGTEAEFDQIWNDFQAFKMAQGYERLQAKQTELMNRNKAALQAMRNR